VERLLVRLADAVVELMADLNVESRTDGAPMPGRPVVGAPNALLAPFSVRAGVGGRLHP